ncbi:MAG TPA: M28 family peptidase, partial [Gemmatimonadales bacterium]
AARAVSTGREGPRSDAADAVNARALLVALAIHPRPAGSGAEARARARCAAMLAELGFDVREERFGYSAAPGRWGTPLGGVASIALLALASLLGARGMAAAALAVLVAGAMALGAAGLWAARRLVLDLPVSRRTGVNLVATRRGLPEPTVWLMAHLDSKSQPVPIGVRAAGVMPTVLAWLSAAVLAVVQLAGAPVPGAWPWVALAGLVGGIPVVLTTVGSDSDGAVDNASGVASVLDAVSRLPREAPLGVVLTSAEELGLAGARAWARDSTPAVALNCDAVDDDGQLVAMYSGPRPDRLLVALDTAARETGLPVRSRRLVPGILTDGVALADAGWEVVTLSRGTRATLGRIHTRRDDLAHLRGDGLEAAGAVLAATVAALLP